MVVSPVCLFWGTPSACSWCCSTSGGVKIKASSAGTSNYPRMNASGAFSGSSWHLSSVSPRNICHRRRRASICNRYR